MQAQQISTLQANLGGLTALVYDLKAKLSRKLGDEFGTSAVPSSSQPEPAVAHPTPEVTMEQYLSSAPSTAEERREKQRRRVAAKAKQGRSLIQRTSDQNIPGDAPQLFIVDDKQRFADKYGDRSGIRMWGFDRAKDVWVVKRKSGKTEYYEKESDLLSLTRVDIAELYSAPFFNPYHVSKARGFMQFLQRQAKTNFDYLNLAESFVKEYKGVINPATGKTFRSVMWPATKKMKKIPVSRPVPDGTLNTMEFWMFDETTSTVLIKRKNDQIRLITPRDLLMFHELDIHTLSRKQIIVNTESAEPLAKEFTAMVAKIIHGQWWAGSLASKTDVELTDL